MELQPFLFAVPCEEWRTHRADSRLVAEWRAHGTTTGARDGAQQSAVDVWEHVVLAFPREGGAVRGRVDGFFVCDDETVTHAGQITGTAVHSGDECTLELEIRSRASTGARLLVRERVVFSADGSVPQRLDVLSSVFRSN